MSKKVKIKFDEIGKNIIGGFQICGILKLLHKFSLKMGLEKKATLIHSFNPLNELNSYQTVPSHMAFLSFCIY